MNKFVGCYLVFFCLGSGIYAGPQVDWLQDSAKKATEADFISSLSFEMSQKKYNSATISSTNTIFDTFDRKWKKWLTMSATTSNLGNKTSIFYGESMDGKNWTVEREPAFNTADEKAWDNSSIDNPIVIFNKRAPKDERYMLWYSAYNNGNKRVVGGIGLAYSLDGKSFTRLSANLSPYSQSGLVISAQSLFDASKKEVSGLLLEPQIALKDNMYHIWFSKMNFDEKGDTTSAAVSQAISKNGIDWQVLPDNPMELRFDRKNVSREYLRNKLHNLSSAYRQMM